MRHLAWCIVLVLVGSCLGAPPVLAAGAADLGVLTTVSSRTASVGQPVTLTIVATNAGPHTSTMDVHAIIPSTLTVTHIDCGPGGPSPDGPFCEYSLVQRGMSRTMTVIATVGSGASDTITTSACVSSEGDTIDPKGGNNCSNQTMPVT